MLGRPSAVTDHAGVFQLSPVAAGSYLLSVQTSDRRGDVVLPLRVREAERREPRIELTRHELALRVVGSRGSELAGARAMLVPAVEPAAKTLGFAGVSAPGVGISRARTAEAGDGGTVRFAGVLCGTYHVRVVADGYLPRSVTSRVPPASEGVVLVELEAGGAIEGDIVDVNGQRVLAPVDVSLGTGENKVETVSDRGRFRLDSVRPGSHVVEASLEPLLATRKPVRQIVHVQPGVTAQVRIVLPP